MTHDKQKLANTLLANFCWSSDMTHAHEKLDDKIKEMDNMADSDDEDALFAFLFLRHTSKKRRRPRRSTWVRSWIMNVSVLFKLTVTVTFLL